MKTFGGDYYGEDSPRTATSRWRITFLNDDFRSCTRRTDSGATCWDGAGGRGLDLIRRGIERIGYGVCLDRHGGDGGVQHRTKAISIGTPRVRGRDAETCNQSRGTLLPRSWPSYQT